MKHSDYYLNKIKFAYSLYKAGKYFKKVRAVIIKDDQLLLIKVCWKNGMPDEYLFPGGGVDDGETISDTAVREALEEYGAVVVPVKNLGKRFYSVELEYNGERFVSKRVEYFYICKCEKIIEKEMGIVGEFNFDDRTFAKSTLGIDEFKKIELSKINHINKNIYNEILNFMKKDQ